MEDRGRSSPSVFPSPIPIKFLPAAQTQFPSPWERIARRLKHRSSFSSMAVENRVAQLLFLACFLPKGLHTLRSTSVYRDKNPLHQRLPLAQKELQQHLNKSGHTFLRLAAQHCLLPWPETIFLPKGLHTLRSTSVYRVKNPLHRRLPLAQKELQQHSTIVIAHFFALLHSTARCQPSQYSAPSDTLKNVHTALLHVLLLLLPHRKQN